MELRNRATRRDEPPPAARGLHDIAMGPTVYAGERYGKMSERLKRQQRRLPDVEKTAYKVMAPRVLGLAIGLLFVGCVILFLRYQTNQRRARALAEEQWGK